MVLSMTSCNKDLSNALGRENLHLQLSSIRMKSLMPKFSRNTPEEAVVLNMNETSALSSAWKVGKWR